MTTEYTNTILFSQSTPMTNSYSSNPSAAPDAAAFSSALDNASKTYADKSENKTGNKTNDNKELAQKTKDIKDSQTPKAADDKPKEPVTNKNQETENKVPNEKPVKTEENKETQNKKETQEVTDNKTTQNKTETQDDTDTPPDSQMQEDALNQAAAEQAALLLKQQAEIMSSADSTQSSVPVQDETGVSADNKGKQNVIANEQILANVEYTDSADVDSIDIKAEKLEQIPDIDEKTLKAIVEEAKKAAGATVPVADETAKTAQQQNADVEMPLEKSTPEIETPADDTVKTDTQPAAKTVKENLASDMSRLTANVEQAVEEPSAEALKAVTPTDTESDKTPVIKVTNEAAETVKENTAAVIENKDITSKVKDKAAAQMTELQDTNTVVTNSEKSSSSSSSQQQDTLSQNNAKEQTAKLSVDEGSVSTNNQANAADTFASRLNSQIASKAAAGAQTLSQSDIMSQVNAKFEQMQQTGTNKVSIVLQPENLGRVSIEIMNTKEGVVAKMLTDNQQVKDLFDKNIESLKNNLSSQGVNVNNIKVECTNQSSNNAMNFEREQFNQSFDNPQNSQHNHTSQTETASQNFYGSDSDGFDEAEMADMSNNEIKNTDTKIKHNGKVDYTV